VVSAEPREPYWVRWTGLKIWALKKFLVGRGALSGSAGCGGSYAAAAAAPTHWYRQMSNRSTSLTPLV
jgi:hypothetical protein